MRLISNVTTPNLGQRLLELLSDAERAWFIAPFVTRTGINYILPYASDRLDLRLITRLYDFDIIAGVMEPDAIASFIERGGKARFYDKSLHAKIWIIDNIALIGSPNLTGSALSGNFEVMTEFSLDSPGLMIEELFEEIWHALEATERTPQELRNLSETLREHPARRKFARPDYPGLLDRGGRQDSRKRPRDRNKIHWLKVNGNADERADPDESNVNFRKYAKYDGCQTFPGIGPGRKGRPTLRAGQHIIFARIGTRDGRSDYCIYGRGIVAVEHRPGVDEVSVNIRSRYPRDVQELIDRWPYIVWLKNIEIINGRASDAPWLRDVGFEADEGIVPGRWAQTGRKKINDRQFNALNSALDRAFMKVGSVDIPDPQQVWWNDRLEDKNLHLTRRDLEREAGI